jgi:hypothetical protein
MTPDCKEEKAIDRSEARCRSLLARNQKNLEQQLDEDDINLNMRMRAGMWWLS